MSPVPPPARRQRSAVALAVVLGGLAALVTAPSGARAQTFVNAGFEAPNLNGSFQYQPTIAQYGAGLGWTFNTSAGIAAFNSAFGPAQPPEGNQVAFLQSGGTSTPSMSQTVSGFTVGQSYTLGFFAAQRSGYPFEQVLGVQADAASLGQFKPVNAAFQFFTTSQFTATASAITFTFNGLTTNQPDVTAFVDAVRINAVSAAAPEPGSAALVALGGFPLVGVVLRRRCRR
jgi:hypothetical protein